MSDAPRDVTELVSALPSFIEESGSVAQMLVDSVVDYAIYLLDLDGVVKSWNAGAQRIKGYSAQQIMGSNFSVFYTEDDIRAGEPKRSLDVARDAGRFEGEGWRVRKDGTRLWASVVIDAVRSPSGSVIGFAKVTRDITQRLAERTALENVSEQLRVTAERYRATLRESNRLMAMAEQMAGVAYWRIDLLANELTWSDGIYQILCLPKSHRPDLKSALEYYHPDDRARVNGCIERSIEHGIPFSYEARIARADASYRDVICSGQVERADDGQIIGVFGVLEDITERKDAESERGRLTVGVRLATRAARVGIWDWDLAANTIDCDPMQHALFGFDEGQVFANFKTWTAAVHDDDRVRVLKDLGEAALGGVPYDSEFRVIWPNGETHVIRAMGAAVRGASGSVERMIGTNWDVTEVRMLAAQLEQEKQRLVHTVDESTATADKANRAKSDFFARMSHEIRTPMNGIIGFATLVLESDLTPEQRRNLTYLHDAGKSLLVILNDILDFSKLEAGKLEIEQVAFSPRAVVVGAMAIIRADALAKGLELECHVANDVPQWVIGDPTRLRQVLLNLVTNALKFTPSGRISVALRPDASKLHLRFEVADSGIGIAFDEQPLLFRDFVQITSSTGRRHGGTGLGLAISQLLVQAMNGTIGMTSLPDHGSTFWFTALLPTTGPPPITEGDVVGGLPCRVLVVDDNSINQIVVQALLKKDGHEVVLVSDGAAAVEAVQAEHFDLVLMDMQMPVMNGEEAARAIRLLDSAVRNIPIVALTANAMDEDIQRCHDAGMNGHLAKPVDRELLRRVITAWASQAAAA